jgi:hypothetical protein
MTNDTQEFAATIEPIMDGRTAPWGQARAYELVADYQATQLCGDRRWRYVPALRRMVVLCSEIPADAFEAGLALGKVGTLNGDIDGYRAGRVRVTERRLDGVSRITHIARALG